MDNRGKRQTSSLFGGMGFYIALLVCVIAAGVVGYFALLNNKEPKPQQDVVLTMEPSEPEPSQSVSLPDDEPARPVAGDEHLEIQRPPLQPIKDLEPEPEPEAPVQPEAQPPAEEPQQTVSAEEPMVMVSPLAGETAAVFSMDQLTYDATLGDWRTHDGIDIQAPAGTAVAAAAAGTVLSVEEDHRLGTTIVVDHHNGFITTYASLQPDTAVLAGDSVSAGGIIGTVGNTSLSEAGLGAHLHFAVTENGEAVDPAELLG